MASLIPMALYGLEVPAGDVAMSARPEVPSSFRITMAAIDPSAEPEGEDGAIPRATLKIIRQPLDFDDLYGDSDEDDYDEDDFDAEEMERILAEEEDSEDDEDSDEAEAGPSDPSKTKAARKAAAEAEIRKLLAEEGMDIDEPKANGLSAKAKGKQPASDDDEDEDDEDDSELYDSDDDLEGEIEEFVICTLDPSKNWQQPLDITIGEDERVWFKVSGTHSIYLTGNYVADANDEESRMYDPEDDEDEDYDLEPDSDELDEDEIDSEEEDELDALADPRITEVEEDEAPALVKADKKSKSKKRAADDEEAETLDDLIKSEEKLSKKQQKKLKKNDGSAAAVENGENGSAKKVQFAKNLEQGPTPTKAKAEEAKATTGPKVVQGVTIDDKKVGTGPAAKKGDRVGMRYIGKLKDGKVFDSNKKGKPFSFKLGAGEVIKGWEIGIQGLTVGGERRITVPAHLAYGSKSLPGIPANSTLIFDVKLIDLNKGK